MGRKYEQGDLNPLVTPRTGMTLDPNRFSAFHLQSSLIDKLLKPPSSYEQIDRFKGIVLRKEEELLTPDGKLVRLRVRIPEIHPFPEPNIYRSRG